MPLTLTFKKGEDFYVGDRHYILSAITPNEVVFETPNWDFVVGFEGAEVAKGIHIIPKKISGGLLTAKISINAPDYRILRGKLYRASLGE